MATLFGLYPFLLKLYADGGYQGPQFQGGLRRIMRHVDVEIVKRSDAAKGFTVLPKRWIVESLWVTFPAACGVSPSHDQRRRQEAGLGLPEATREPPIGSLLKYPAACGGDPLSDHRMAQPMPSTG